MLRIFFRRLGKEKRREKKQTRRKKVHKIYADKATGHVAVSPYLSNFLFRFISSFIFVILLPKTIFEDGVSSRLNDEKCLRHMIIPTVGKT